MAQGDLATDRPGSWIVAACCCFCNLTFYGVARLSGIMLVATHQTFQVSRASAAVPFSMSTAIRNLAGVFVGHLGHRFGVGPVVAAGCLIASLGAALCFFVMDLQWLIVCWGGLFGFGFGLSTCLLPLAINQNFVKHNGMASGISYSGSYLGSFIFPPVVVWLLDSYGLQGTFLVIAGFLLNVLVAALLLNRPKKASRKKYVVDGSSSQDSLCRDSYKPSKEISVLCKRLEEDGEMLRRNINRAFMDSQHDLRDKSRLKSGVSLGVPVYASQRTLCQECSSNDKLCSLCCPHSRLSISQHAILSDLLRDFKFGGRHKEGKDVGSEEGSLGEANSLEADGESILSFDSSKCSNTYSMGSAARQVPTAPKKCLRKLIDCNLFSKSKCKAKYKLKLQKLKKAVIATILRIRGAGKKSVQPGDVTLTSFKNLQTFLCPSSYKIVIPDEDFHLTVSQRSLFTPCSSGNKELPSSTLTTSPLPDANSTESVATIFPPEAKEVKNPLSTSDCSLTNNRKYITSWVENDSLPKTSNSSEQRDFNHSFLHAYRNYNRLQHNLTRKDSAACCKASNLFSATDQNCNHSYKTIADKVFPHLNIAEDALSNTDKHKACYSGKSFFNKDSTQNNGIPSFSSELSLRCTPESGSTNENSSIPPPRRKFKAIRRYFSDWFHMLREPMFTVIGFTMSIQTFIVVCVVTTIEDYAKDMGIPENRTYYALMALSISNFVGTLTLGTLTDRGLISRHRFLSLCFFGMSLSLVAVSLVAVSLPSLLSLVTLYGLLESGVIITFPILTKEFIPGERRQAVAIASSNVLSAPTVMLVPMLIGHFRDNIGCYSGLFHLLGATSFTCSLLWLFAPHLCQKRRLKKNVQDIVTKC